MIICLLRSLSICIFFKHSVTTYKSTSLSIECCRHLIAWLIKFIENEPAVFWPVGFLQISLDEKNPMTESIIFVSKDNKYERKVRWKVLIYLFFWLNSSCTLSCSLRLNLARFLLIFCLVRSVSTSEARSSTSASSSSFIHFWLVSSFKLDIWEAT